MGNRTETKFQRRLPAKALEGLTKSASDGWLKDLLGLWVPSGHPAGEHGLRLAIRNGYLNFYHQGQSIAQVKFDRSGKPYAYVHHKYVRKADGQKYARLSDDKVLLPDGSEEPYSSGGSSLKRWIEESKKYSGLEKKFVDQLISDNPSIIDLEMALPAYGEYRTAKRMDCVALEKVGAEIGVVFWEAKTIDDKRLRSSTGEPEVCNQLAYYRTYLMQEDKAKAVSDAYIDACKLLRAIAEMAGKRELLDPMVLKVAGDQSERLVIDDVPKLVVIEGGTGGEQAKRPTTWNVHLDKLKEAKVPCVVIHNSSGYKLNSQLLAKEWRKNGEHCLA